MINKSIFFYALLFSLIITNTPLAIAVDGKSEQARPLNGWLEQRMSLECNGRPLQEILKNVATFFKTTIVYEAEGDDRPVQCHYSMTTVEQILDRLFRKQNRAILIEESPKKKITVQIFGVSKYNIVSNDGSSTTVTLPFLGNMTNESLAAMQKEQLKKYREELTLPDAIIPGVGITRAELTKLHQQQIQQHEKSQHDTEEIVAGTAMTKQQLRAIQEQQLHQYEQEKQDQNQTDPLTGLTRAQTSELHHQQMQHYLAN